MFVDSSIIDSFRGDVTGASVWMMGSIFFYTILKKSLKIVNKRIMIKIFGKMVVGMLVVAKVFGN